MWSLKFIPDNRSVSGGRAPEDVAVYSEAAVRAGVSRWAAEPSVPPNLRFGIVAVAGEPGEICVMLVDAKHDARAPLLRRCTFATVWTASATINAAGTAVALAVQPLSTWRELWVFRKHGDNWSVDVLPPASIDPGIGYVEFAGWVPGGKQFLTAREARVGERWVRSFEVVRLDTLSTERLADRPDSLSQFYRWRSPAWKQQTVSVR